MKYLQALFLLPVLLLITSCGAVKERRTVEAPTAYADAQTADLEQLVRLVNEKYAGIHSMTISQFEVEFTGGSVEQGYLEKYRKAKGYLVAKGPDSIFVNILNPLTNSSVLTMAAQQQRFQLWLPSRNQYVTGSTEVQSDDSNPIYNVRPSHFLNGILVEKIPVADDQYRYFQEEVQDGRYKYYVVTILKMEGSSGGLRLVRKIWVERSRLQMVRQQYYEGPSVVGTIDYDRPVEVDGRLVNSKVKIERPLDKYTISFAFEKDAIQVDREIEANAFQIDKPPAAELVVVQESGASGL